jgi:hypothetical protein
MKPRIHFLSVALLLVVVMNIRASGPVGICGVIEKVVFEPSEQAPERLQVWGAFAYVDGAAVGSQASEVRRGYLYFKVKDANLRTASETPAATFTEWKDLKSVAGTGQAVAFGRWIYIGAFGSLMPDARSGSPPYILENIPAGGGQTDLRVRPESEKPANPAAYQTNSGVVKLPDQGNYADLVKKLKAALKS